MPGRERIYYCQIETYCLLRKSARGEDDEKSIGATDGKFVKPAARGHAALQSGPECA